MYLPMKDGDIFEMAIKEDVILRDVHFKGRDIVFFNRLPGYELQHLLNLKHSQPKKFKIVIDIDDFWKLYPQHINFNDWERAGVSRKLEEIMGCADMIFTTNSRLASEIVKINSRVHIFPNAFPYGSHQFDDNKGEVKNQRVRFVYVGGTSHYYDLKSIENVFKQSKSDIDLRTKAHFILGGYVSSEDYWVRAFNMIGQSGNITTRGRADLNTYMNLYKNSEVSLAPLETNKFNTYKSTIKIAEAGCKRMPIIASNIWPYLEDEEMNGKGLILCSTTSDWMDAIKFFVNNPEKIKEYGDALHEYVIKKYNLHTVNASRYETFKSLL